MNTEALNMKTEVLKYEPSGRNRNDTVKPVPTKLPNRLDNKLAHGVRDLAHRD